MALEGTLKDFSLADIFQLIGIQRKTGVLTLRNGKEVATISFINGMVVAADTDNQKLENRLGHVLVKTNRISQAELEQALAIQESTLQRLGQVLIFKGFIKPEDLRDSLKTQVCEIIYRLFRWTDGDYHFRQERYIDYDQENFSPIGAESILMEGIRMIDEWPMIERAIPSMDLVLEKTEKGQKIRLKIDNNLSFSSGPVSSFDDLLQGVIAETPEEKSIDVDLPHEQELVLKLIEQPQSVQQIVERSRLNEFETCRALYDLIEAGLIQKMHEDSQPKEVRVVEEQKRLPLWIPGSLLALVASASFLLAWNPLNDFLPLGFQESRDPFFEDASLLRMQRIHHAIQYYFIQRAELPENLEILCQSGFLDSDYLIDPRGARYTYKVIPDQLRFTLVGAGGSFGVGGDRLYLSFTFPESPPLLPPSP
jgi:predicted transcriptional regulator